MATTEGLPCLDDTVAVSFLDGLLSTDELASVETHLDHCDPCRRQLSAMVRARGSAPATRDAARPFPMGAVLGRYELRRLLGIGSMGMVYAAFDGQLKREIALKVMRPGGNRERLLVEAQAMARVRDPHVVAVHDVGSDGPHVYIAMELVRGTTLTEWARRPHTRARALGVLVQAGRGLVAAHAAGVVHRDFKPDNVLVGDDGRVCVTDLGLARAAPEPSRDSAGGVELTQNGVLVGTPAYMAPEALRGEPGTPASDAFSFSVSVYEVLCGNRPFAGMTVDELLDATTGGRFAPSRAVPRAIERGLAVDPAARPAITTLLDALAPSRRARWLALALAIALGIVAIAMFGVFAIRSPESTCAQIDDAWNAGAQVKLRIAVLGSGAPSAPFVANAVERALDRYVGGWQRLAGEVCAGDPVAAPPRESCLDDRRLELEAWLAAYRAPDRTAVDRALEGVEALVPVDACRQARPKPAPADPVATARLDRELAELSAMHAAGHYIDAQPRAEAAVARARAMADRSREARALLVRGRLLLDGGDATAAEPVLFAAFTTASEVGDDAIAARAGIQQIYAYGWRLARLDDARRWVELTRAIVTRIADDDLAAMLDSSEAAVMTQRGEYAAAIRRAERALAAHRRLFGEASVAVMRAHHTLGSAYLEADQFQAAEAPLQSARAIAESLFGATHPATATMKQALGALAVKRGRYTEAAALYRSVLAIRRATLPTDHPSVAESLGALGDLLVGSDPQAALPLLAEAIAISERRLGPDHPQLAMWLYARGEAELGLHRIADARASLSRALQILERGANRDTVAIPLVGLAELEHDAKNFAESEALATRAIAILDRDPTPNLNGLAQARFTRAKSLWALSRPADARASAERSRADYARAALGPEDDSLATVDAWLREHPLR